MSRRLEPVKRFPESEYHVPFFDEHGYVRKLCPKCREYFWTQNPDQETCGEATPEGCEFYKFIKNPPTRKRYSLSEMRETFLSFFEKRGHERIKPYPVVARWRDDIYFTHASVIDFQPYVTDGIIPPPANPLVVCQPCIRFVDIDNVGPTFGRHLTIFEMGGHHAFNYPDEEVYWKDQTVRYHHEFVTEVLGVPSEEVIYKEGVWSGGGNAGPDLESIIRGLEVATLVFMNFKVVNGDLLELPIRTVDTGYGIERYTWLSQGSSSCFQAVYGRVLDEIFEMAGVAVDDELLVKVSRHSGMLSLEKVADRLSARRVVAKFVGMNAERLDELLLPVESVFAVADHTKCLAFILAEGVVPSNVREGYLARLLLRRTYRLLRMLGIEERLLDIVDLQIDYWLQGFPHLMETRDKILEVLSIERDKYRETLRRGGSFVKRIVQELRSKGELQIPAETLVQLYDSHGLPPEFVREVAEKEGVKADVPESFYMMVAARHVQAPPPRVDERTRAMEAKVEGLPETRTLYYEDPYMKVFEATVLRVLDKGYLVLNQTAFYPEGGGQPPDQGYISFDGNRCRVVDVQKVGRVIVHKVEDSLLPEEGSKVRGEIDWDRRYSLMKAHTATHVLMGAARRVLGEHVWQSGTQKGSEHSRLDISHYRRLTLEETHRIEELANLAVARRIPVETVWMPRGEAERTYGFRLYQGGVVPGKEVRVVKIGDWDVVACGGTHLKNTGEIGFMKILNTERIQDGVERLVFSVGLPALKAIQRKEKIILNVAEILGAPLEKLPQTAKHVVEEWREARRRERRLLKEIAIREGLAFGEGELAKREEIDGIVVLERRFGEVDVERMIQTASERVKKEANLVVLFYASDEKTARVVVMAGKEAVSRGVNASEVAEAAALVLGGGGGGRRDFAQGGGPNPRGMEEAIRKAKDSLRKQLEKG